VAITEFFHLDFVISAQGGGDPDSIGSVHRGVNSSDREWRTSNLVVGSSHSSK
jgi:hypothetical protein